MEQWTEARLWRSCIYARVQILVLMPLGFGPFSFLDPLDPFVPSLYSPPDSPDMQLALPRPGLLMPLKVSWPGAARVLPARLFLKHPQAAMQARPQMLDASSASGEMPRLSKDAQTSPLARCSTQEAGGWRCHNKSGGAGLDAQVGRWLILTSSSGRGGYLRLTQQQQNLISGLRRWTIFSKLSSGLAA